MGAKPEHRGFSCIVRCDVGRDFVLTDKKMKLRGSGMDESCASTKVAHNLLVCIEEHLRRRLSGRAGHVQVTVHDEGLVLRGRAQTYYMKQLAQQAVMEITALPIRSNDIQVSPVKRQEILS